MSSATIFVSHSRQPCVFIAYIRPPFLMVENYLKIAFRNLLGNKTFSLFHLLGLALVFVLLENWLFPFAYRVPLSGWVLMLASRLVILVAFIRVSVQVLKASRIHPVLTLCPKELHNI